MSCANLDYVAGISDVKRMSNASEESPSSQEKGCEKEKLLAPADKPLLQRAWPWLILGFAATDVIFLGGKRRAFGSFVSELNIRYNDTISLSELNWIGDSYCAIGYMLTGVSTYTILSTGRRFRFFQTLGALFILASCISSALVPNPHWLFLSHTLLHGIGSSLVLSVTSLIVSEYFGTGHPYRILATTLISGGSVGSVIFVIIFAVVIQALGWRTAFWVLGLLYFVVFMLGVTVFAKNPAVKNYTGIATCGSKCSGCADPLFAKRLPLLILWIIDRLLTSITTYGLLMNLTDLVRQSSGEHGLVNSSTLTSVFTFGEAITYVIGAIVMGLTKTFFRNRLRFILIASTIVMAMCLCLLEEARRSMIPATVLTFFAGVGLGPSITFLFPAGEEFTTLPGHVAYPFSLAGMGVGMLLSPTLSAMIAERFRYRWFFLTQGGLCWMKVAALTAGSVYLARNAKELVTSPPDSPLKSEDKEEKTENSK